MPRGSSRASGTPRRSEVEMFSVRTTQGRGGVVRPQLKERSMRSSIWLAVLGICVATLALPASRAAAQTVSLVRDIDPGPPDLLAHPSSAPSGLQAVGDKVFFSADTTGL